MVQVSVVMPVYNFASFLGDALKSILAQTFTDFELIVVNDGSTDPRVGELLREAAAEDRRVKVREQENSGLTRSLNRAIPGAQAPLVARMDADDLSHPERLALQVACLSAHPEVGLVGTYSQAIDEEGHSLPIGVKDLPAEPEEFAGFLRSGKGKFVHGSALFRKEIWEKAGGYEETLTFAQDSELWQRMSRFAKVGVIPRILYFSRLHPGQVTFSRLHLKMQVQRLILEAQGVWKAGKDDRAFLRRSLAGLPGLDKIGPGQMEYNFLYFLGSGLLSSGEKERARGYLGRLLRRNPWRAKAAAKWIRTFF